MEHHAVHTRTKGAVAHGFQRLWVVLPSLQRPAGKGFGVEDGALQVAHDLLVLAHVLPSPVGIGPELRSDNGSLGCIQYPVYVEHAERLLSARAVRLNQQGQSRCLLCQFRHVAVVVFGKQLLDGQLPVLLELVGLPFAANALATANHVGQIGHDVVAPALLEFSGEHTAPCLSARFVTVYLEVGESLACMVAGNVDNHLRIGLPELQHRLAAQLVALQSTARFGRLSLVGLADGGLSDAEHHIVRRQSLGQLQCFRLLIIIGSQVHHIARLFCHRIGRNGHHGHILVIIPHRIHFGTGQIYRLRALVRWHRHFAIDQL